MRSRTVNVIVSLLGVRREPAQWRPGTDPCDISALSARVPQGPLGASAGCRKMVSLYHHPANSNPCREVISLSIYINASMSLSLSLLRGGGLRLQGMVPSQMSPSCVDCTT